MPSALTRWMRPLPRGYTLALIYTVHLLLVHHALPLDMLLDPFPFNGPDYQTHYQQTSTLSESMDRFGHLWAYDPGLLAGHPIGVIFDVDNKLHFLFTYGLTKLGVPRPIAFKLFTLISALLAPLFILWAARMFGLRPRERLIAFAAAALCWHFDSFGRFTWIAGMISFATASYWSVLVLACYYRLIRTRSWKIWAALALLLPLTLLAHVWAFAILAVPMVALYLRGCRQTPVVGHLQVWALALTALAFNLYWLVPALRFFHMVSPSGVLGQSMPLHLVTDWLEVLINPFHTGFAIPHTLVRFTLIIGAVLTLWRWRKEGDERLFFGLLTLGWLFGMAYFAAFIPGLRETEPYRFIIPCIYMAGILGAPWFSRALELAQYRALPRRVKQVLVVLLILLIPRVAAQLLYFMPELIPRPEMAPTLINQARLPSTSLIPTIDPRNPSILNRPMGTIDRVSRELAAYVTEHCREGRVLVQHWAVGEFLRWSTDRPIVGGFPDRRLRHEAANIFRRIDDPRFREGQLAQYLARYNIHYLVVTDPFYNLEKRDDLLQPRRYIGPHRVYRVKLQMDYFARGTGQVTAGLNRIEVRGAVADPATRSVVLRFHHMETLVCRPRCRVLREPIPFDSVGFIKVEGEPTLPADFVIENRY